MQSWDRSHLDRFTVTANFQRSSSRDWCRFPRIPDHGVQESRIPASSLHSAFQCTIANHASVYRSNDHLFCCHVEPNAFKPCRFQFVDQCSWSSARQVPLQRVRFGLSSDMCRIFSYAVLVESCLLWNLVYCHAACRGNQVSRGLSALMVIPEFFCLDLVGFDLITYRLHHPFCPSVTLVAVFLRLLLDDLTWWMFHYGTFRLHHAHDNF